MKLGYSPIRHLRAREYSAFAVSMGVHCLLLLAMWLYRFNVLAQDQNVIAVETTFSDEEQPQEFTQSLETTEIVDAISPIGGSAVSTTVGVSQAPAVNQVKIEQSETLKEPDIKINLGEISVPAGGELAIDLGESQVSGQIGAAVSGYSEALSRITKEIIRLMRDRKVHVVWLFDQSDSTKDDQAEIRQEFGTVYEQLKIAQEDDGSLKKKGQNVLLTSVIAFGKEVVPLTKKPTSDIKKIQAAIDKIPVDESGKENMCQAVSVVIDRFRRQAVSQKRRLAIIVVSDESGDDGHLIEDAISKARSARTPVYILGRESIFGYPYAQIIWRDPEYNLPFWVQINRGPETAFPECLQWDGLRARYDAFAAGFGPYEQVRLAKETGGIFFVLPSEEENLSGAGANEKRKFDFLDMKEYQPLLLTRSEYVKRRNRSEFRKQLWEVIARLNPHLDSELNIKVWYYSTDPVKFEQEGQGEFSKAVRAMGLTNQAIAMLDEIQPLRAKEDKQRWRAAYDLTLAQCLAYRVRLFQYLLAVDQHAKQKPLPKNPKSNRWNVARRREMLPPDPEQVRITKVDPDELREQEKLARDKYHLVIKQHPRTPWAKRAQYELDMGFGLHFVEDFWDPRYAELQKKNIKPPNQ